MATDTTGKAETDEKTELESAIDKWIEVEDQLERRATNKKEEESRKADNSRDSEYRAMRLANVNCFFGKQFR